MEKHAPTPAPLETRTVELAAGRHAPGQAREWLRWVAAYLDPGQFEAARLMVSELVSNSVEHSGVPEGGPIHVCAKGCDSGILVSVRDRGHGFDQDVPPARPPADSIGRRGLWIVHQLADSVVVDGAHGRVAFVLQRGPSLL